MTSPELFHKGQFNKIFVFLKKTIRRLKCSHFNNYVSIFSHLPSPESVSLWEPDDMLAKESESDFHSPSHPTIIILQNSPQLLEYQLQQPINSFFPYCQGTKQILFYNFYSSYHFIGLPTNIQIFSSLKFTSHKSHEKVFMADPDSLPFINLLMLTPPSSTFQFYI